MKIQLKRSNVLSGGSAKEPTAAQMEYGELAVNYNEADPAIFIKDSNNNIIRIAGANISYDDLENLPVIGDGTITLQESNGNTIGTFTVNQTGDTDITLPEFFSGDYNDLDNLPTIGDGEITILDSEGNAIGSFTVNQEDPTEITLPAINDGVLTINAPNGDELGTFSANTDQSVEIDIPAAKWDELVGNPISIGDTEPGSPSLGDIWIDTSQCPPVMNIWDDCESPGNPIWTPIGGGDAGTPLLVNTPTLSAPTVCIGDVVTSSFGSALGGAPPYTYTYIFSNDDGVVQDSAANTYTLQASDKDKSITCVVHCVDGEADEADSNPSNPVGPVEECLTLTVGKGNITPKLGVEEGDTLTGTASVLEASNPVETHVWELDGVEVQRGNTRGLTSTYVAAAGEVRYRMEVTDDNNQSPVIGEWSDVVTVAEAFDPTKPNATMYGLRFDPLRNTFLKSSFPNTSNKFTFSAWMKPTVNEDDKGIFSTATNASTDGSFRLQIINRGGIRIVCYNGGDKVSSSIGYTLNTWVHVWATFDNGVVKLSLNNGTPIESNFGAFNVVFNKVIVGGITHNGTSGDDTISNTYLSDVYFVDGQALEPTAFGKSFEGKWGPLDSSVILPKFQPKTIETDEITDVTPLTGTDVTLTFASDKDLALIEVGDTLFQDDSDINTSVAAVFAPINADQDVTTNLGYAGALTKTGTVITEPIINAKANSWGITSAASTSDSNSRLTCPLVTIGGDFTFDIFVNIKANSNAGGNADSFILGDWEPGSNNFQLVWNNTSNANPERFKFYMNGQDVLTSAGTFGFNWYHIRITREGNDGKLYVDGKLEGTGTISGQLNAAFSLFSRTNNNNNALVGNLTGFYLYNGVNLGAPQDIAEIYKGKHLFAPIGNVNSVNLINNTVSLTSSSGTWGPSNNNHYAIGPTKGLSFGANGFHLPFKTEEENNYQVGPITTVSTPEILIILPYARRVLQIIIQAANAGLDRVAPLHLVFKK